MPLISYERSWSSGALSDLAATAAWLEFGTYKYSWESGLPALALESYKLGLSPGSIAHQLKLVQVT